MNSETILAFARKSMELMPNGTDSIKFYNNNLESFLPLLVLNEDDYYTKLREMMIAAIDEKRDYVVGHGYTAKLNEFVPPLLQHLYDGELDAKGTSYAVSGIEKNVLLTRLVVADWLASKQVFQVSSELITSLIGSIDDNRGLSIYLQSFDHLPFRSFYITLDNVSSDINLDNVSAVLVGYYKLSEQRVCLTISCINSSAEIFNVMNIDFVDAPDNKNPDTHEFAEVRMPNNRVKKFLWLIISIILYLGSDKPDVKESEETKHTFRKSSSPISIKNKFRELREWEVGVRYSTSVKNVATKRIDGTHDITHNSTTKRPHIRRAHWHHFWIGKGRNTLVLKWVDQVHVNANWDSELPVVVHPE